MDRHVDAPNEHENLIKFVEDRPGHDRRYAINTEKIMRELNVSPSIDFDEGFARTVSWYLNNEAWWRPLVNAEKFGHRLGLNASV